MKDYSEEDAEDAVLSRWGKLKQWFEIAMATRKLYLFVMSILIATGGSVVVGQATDTNPIRDAAIALGILDEQVLQETPDGTQLVHNHDAIEAELKILRASITEHSHILELPDQEVEWAAKDHMHEGVVIRDAAAAGLTGPPGPVGLKGDKGDTGPRGENAPTNVQAIDDALLFHIEDDH